MNWNDDILKEIEELAALPSFTPQMVCQVMGISVNDFLEIELDENHPVLIAINKGKLKSLAEFDKKVVQLSNQGSGPAQSLQKNLRKETEYYKLLDKYGRN